MTCERAVAWVLVMIAAPACIAAAGEEPGAARQQLKELPPAEKRELDGKRERFYSLSEREQHRLRDLHQDLCEAADSDRLRNTMQRYAQWLKTLSSGQRAELLSMPIESRLEQIKLLLQQQEEWRVRSFGLHQLSDADLAAVMRWREEFISRHEAEILEHRPELRERWESLDPPQRRQMLMFFAMTPSPGREPLRPSEEEILSLKAELSETARQELTKAQREGRLAELAERWMRAAMFSRRAPAEVSREELQRFYAELDVREREYLESLPAERMQMELTRKYHFDRWRRFDSDRPPFMRPGSEGFRGGRGGRGRPGEGPSGDPPPGDVKPPSDRPAGPHGPPPHEGHRNEPTIKAPAEKLRERDTPDPAAG